MFSKLGNIYIRIKCFLYEEIFYNVDLDRVVFL